jgi:predicted metal-dependent peptidase
MQNFQMNQKEKMENALRRIQVHHPFYYFMCADLEIVADESFETMATDGLTLFYNPRYVDRLTENQVEAVVLHEFMHVILLHPWLSEKAILKGHNREIWTLAMEFVANREVRHLADQRAQARGQRKSEISLPGRALGVVELLDLQKKNTERKDIYFFDHALENMDVQDIYHYLRIRIVLRESDEDGMDDCSKPGASTSRLKNLRGWAVSRERIEELIEKHLRGQEDVARRVREKFMLAPTIFGSEWAKIHGALSDGFKRAYSELTSPEIDWRKFLATVAGRLTDTDEFRFDAPNLRHPLARDVVQAGLRSEKPDGIFIAIDTSGSVDKNMLTQFLSECAGILRYLEDVNVMTVDCKEAPIQRVRPRSLRNLQITGGGGTDFRPVFTRLKKERITPNLLVYFTDGFGEFPSTPPRYPVLWVLTRHSGVVPEGHGRVVYLNRV